MNAFRERLSAERERLGLSRADVADALSVDRTTVLRWEKKISIPADKLSALIEFGFDAKFILTGKRSSAQPSASRQNVEPCTAKEVRWLRIFRSMRADTQERAIAVARVLAESDGVLTGKKAKTGNSTVIVKGGKGQRIAGRDVNTAVIGRGRKRKK